jgi:hypothetical protein
MRAKKKPKSRRSGPNLKLISSVPIEKHPSLKDGALLRVNWDNDKDAVGASALFSRQTRDGRVVYHVDARGKRGKAMHEFDPQAKAFIVCKRDTYWDRIRKEADT